MAICERERGFILIDTASVFEREKCILCTVEPLNKGHLGTQAAVPYSEVVPYWEVRDKTVILCTFTASMMYKTHYGVIK